MRKDDASFLETPLQRYFGYGAFEFSMKWLDYGDSRGGLTLYSRDPRYTAQGLLLERPERSKDEFALRWLHFPTIAPGRQLGQRRLRARPSRRGLARGGQGVPGVRPRGIPL